MRCASTPRPRSRASSCICRREGYGVEYLDERNKLIAAVTMDDAKRAAKRLFGDGKLLVTVAGRPRGCKAVRTGASIKC